MQSIFAQRVPVVAPGLFSPAAALPFRPGFSAKKSSPSDVIMDAIHDFLSGNIPASAISNGLQAKAPKTSKLYEGKIEAFICDGSRFNASLASMKQSFPQRVVKRFPRLREYSEQKIKLVEWTQRHMGAAALDWARRILAEKPELALSLIDHPSASDLFAESVSVCMAKTKSAGSKKKEKVSDKAMLSIPGRTQKIIQTIEDLGVAHDHDACMIAIADELCGGIKTMLLFVLAIHYTNFFWYAIGVSIGISADQMKHARQQCAFGNEAFIDDLFRNESIIRVDGVTMNLVANIDEEAIADYSYVSCLQMFMACETAGEIASLIDDHEAERKKMAKDLDDAIKSARASEKAAEKLRAQTPAANEIRRLSDELAAAKLDIAALRDECARKEDRISRLLSRPAQASLVSLQPSLQETPSPVEKAQIKEVSEEALDDIVARLRSIKGVVVGGHTNFINKLRVLLPEWAYFSTDHKRVNESLMVGTELAVLFTGHCNHPLSESAQRIIRLHGIPFCYATKVNPPAFLREVVSKTSLNNC